MGEDTAQTDMEKIQMILTKIGKSEKNNGKMQGPEWKRIIKVRLAHADGRKIILGETKTLKEAGDNFKDIYVCKDVHPLVNKVFHRLKEVEKQEREKTENQGRTAVYNATMRTIIVDAFSHG